MVSVDGSPMDGCDVGHGTATPWTELNCAHGIPGTSITECRSGTDQSGHRAGDGYFDDLHTAIDLGCHVPLHVCSESCQHAAGEVTGLQQGVIPTRVDCHHRTSSSAWVPPAPIEGAFPFVADTAPSFPLDPSDGQHSTPTSDPDVEALSLTVQGPSGDDTPALPTYQSTISDAEEPPHHRYFYDVTAYHLPASCTADEDYPLTPMSFATHWASASS